MLCGYLNVVLIYSMNGCWDFVVELYVDLFEYFDCVFGVIWLIDGIVNIEMSILLLMYKV